MATVLLVESSPQQARHLSDLLAVGGHDVRSARNGTEALAAVAPTPPDVIVTDLAPPEADGLDLIRRMRARHPSVPVLVVAEAGGEERAVAALRAGAASYLLKRNSSRDLLPMLTDLLQVSQSQHKRAVFLRRMTGVEYQFELENDPDLIGNVVSQVELVMQQMQLFDDADRMRVGVGVHEAAVNAMVHGNLQVSSDLKKENWETYHRAIGERAKQPPYKDRRVTITVRAARRAELCIRIADQGPGFDPATLPDPTDPDNLDKGCGRGMLLIRTFFDEVRHNPTGNEITLVKRVGHTPS